MSISTRTGDQGMTGLLYGQRVPKNHPQIEALGACDELNTAIGLARAAGGHAETLLPIQHNLVALMGEIACSEEDAARHLASKFKKLDDVALAGVDRAAAALEARGLRFDGWATPGGSSLAAAYDQARVVARRAERHLVGLPATCGRTVRPSVLAYINRVSDLLWLLAREAEQASLPPAGQVASRGT